MNRGSRALLRVKLVLTAIVLTVALVLLVLGSWPFKVLVVLTLIRGLFATDVITLRNTRPRRSASLIDAATPG